MSKTFYVSHSGISIKFRFSRWTPFIGLHQKIAVYLLDHMSYVYTYSGESSADVEQKIWQKKEVL